MKTAMSEMKNTLKWINCRWDKAEGQISDLKDKVVENTQEQHNKEKQIEL